MGYAFNPNARIRADADAAGALFERLEAEGRLTAGDVVDESRPEDAPLHDAFEWNDGIAAEEYRKEQARHLIRNIRIINEPEEPRRVYFNIIPAEPEYRSINTILMDEDMTDRLLKKALGDLIAWQKRYKEVKALTSVFREIEKARAQYAITGFTETRVSGG